MRSKIFGGGGIQFLDSNQFYSILIIMISLEGELVIAQNLSSATHGTLCTEMFTANALEF